MLESRTVAYIRGPFTPANARTNTIYNTEYDYDDAGNITTLQRNGLVLLSVAEEWANPTGDFGDLEANVHFGQTLRPCSGTVDDLVYFYSAGSSRLGAIVESATSAGAELGVPQSTNIVYDLLGNITAIPGKELEVTAYNKLNLPGTMKVKDKTIKHTYDGSGAKLATERVGGKLTIYGGPAIVEDGRLVSLQFPDGRMVPELAEDGTLKRMRYQYKIQDHLGNTVVYFEDTDDDGEIAEEEVLQRELYYPVTKSWGRGPSCESPLDNYWSKPAPVLTPSK